MFDLGWSEILVIAIVAILVIGPKDLPKFLKVVTEWLGKMRRMASHFQAGVDEMIRQSELDDLRKDLQTLRRETSRPIFPPMGSPSPMVTTPPPSKMVATTDADIVDVEGSAPPAVGAAPEPRTYIEPPPPPPTEPAPPSEPAKTP